MQRIQMTGVLLLFLPVLVFGQDFTLNYEFRYHLQSEIEYDAKKRHFYHLYAISTGEHLVFELVSNNAGDPGNHSKAESIVAFQVAPELKEFRLSGQEIADHGGIYVQRCKCQDRGIQAIQDGTITGKLKEDGTWEIDVNVNPVGRLTKKVYHIQTSGEFKPAKD